MSLHLRPKRVSQYGLVAEYRFNQRNLLKWSEPLLSNVGVRSAVAQANFTENSLSNGIQFPALQRLDYAYLTNFVCTPNTIYSFSAFIIMDDNSVPRPGGNIDPNKDFQILVNGVATTIFNVVNISNNLYRVSINITSPSWTNTNTGIVRYATQSGKGFRVTGYQLELGTQATTYQKTTDLQVLQDYGRYGYHGQLGTGSGVDGSDPIPDGQSYIYDGVDDCVIVGDTGKSMYSLQIAFYVSAAISKSTTGKTLVNLETSPGGFVGMGSITGALTDEIITVGDSDGGRSGWCSATDSIAIGWHIIEVVWDGSKYNIYLDNVEKTITTAGTPRLISMSAVQLGRLITPGNYFAGKQSYLVLCDRSLSDEERAQNRATIKSKLKLRGVDATW